MHTLQGIVIMSLASETYYNEFSDGTLELSCAIVACVRLLQHMAAGIAAIKT